MVFPDHNHLLFLLLNFMLSLNPIKVCIALDLPAGLGNR